MSPEKLKTTLEFIKELQLKIDELDKRIRVLEVSKL